MKLPCSMLNRHGLVAGATGTGKTVTLQVLAEQLSKQGIAVFSADVKGDLSGLAHAGISNPKIEERLALLQDGSIEFSPSPVAFWDLYGKKGVPLRTTVSEVGPLLFSHILELNDTQADVLHLLFQFGDQNGLLLLELEDLIALVHWVSENREEFIRTFGNVAPATLSAILRKLNVLNEAGGDKFFGEPAFRLADLLQTDFSGRGVIHLLEATDLLQEPRLYSAFLVWLLSELFEELEESGDKNLPKLVFFFDEAHLLFSQGSKALIEKFELVVRLIRSKGVGIFFVTQNPLDIPETIRAQLGAKVLHALRAFTPKEQKALKVLSDTFVRNPDVDPVTVIPALRVGEALVSGLDEQGVPSPVEQTLIRPPFSQIGPISDSERLSRVQSSPFYSAYYQPLERESAFEVLKKRTEVLEQQKQEEAQKKKAGKGRQSVFESFIKSAVRSIGSYVGREIIRGVLGSMSRK
ncbi:MAG: DUF853 family protein [Bdellovibrionales bacterium]|nr:DUF853 family protein [Bdellovibrionales bacterium]